MTDIKLLFDKSFINGEWVSVNKKKFNVTDPATGEVVFAVHDGGKEAVDLAITAAYNAKKEWETKTAKSRAVLLEALHIAVLEHKEEIANLITKECGKPFKESLGEVAYAASFLKWFAEEGRRMYGDVIPSHKSDNRIIITKQPVGVVAIITPWNFPLAMITRKIGAALAAGCTVVVRPSELTPLTALALAYLTKKVGFPAGTINFVIGENAAGMGEVLCSSKLVKKISFTGSTRVGRLLMLQSAPTLKKLSLELGGNAPFIVFEDAELEAAVDGAILSKFRNAGQTCVCTNRILVHENIHDGFISRFVDKVAKLKLGNGMGNDVQVGPMIDRKAIEKMTELMENAIEKGGQLLIGGNSFKDLFFEPTVIGNATPEMKLANDEIFGPIAPIFKFSTDEE
ncbi:MAG: NAD-dependent succinate-semialdehyde dehydrogenase, partial [Bacteroidota bacterium]